MKKYRILNIILVLTIIIGYISGCDDTKPDRDTIPTASAYPENDYSIGETQQITITFNKSMDINTLIIGGDIGNENPIITWSTTSLRNDTLTLSPNPFWTPGDGKTFSISCKDLDGKVIDTLSLKYNVNSTTPSVSVFPLSGANILSTQQIIISFSESMDTNSLILDGGLSMDDPNIQWTTVVYNNDTLIISPQTTWLDGNKRILLLYCKNPAGNEVETILYYSIDSSKPTYTVSPANNSQINGIQQIIISFSESMDTNTLLTGGDMGDMNPSITWSTTSFSNDTLTISPDTLWPNGQGITLTIDCNDQSFNSIDQINLSYEVDSTLPTLTTTPLSESTISNTQGIVIIFSESMDTNTIVLTGIISSESDGGSWSTTINTNDTLSINPDTIWSEGTEKALIVNGKDLWGNSLIETTISYNVDTTSPSIENILPASNKLIMKTQKIVITFTESMDTLVSPTLGGTMASQCDSVTWSTTAFTNDTLSISPLSFWTTGIGKTLTINNCTDLVGNAMSIVNLTYTIQDGESIVYVNINIGSDSNPGTPSEPKKTIQSGIDFAYSHYSIAKVYVAEGTYSVNYHSGTHIILRKGISLYGGYSNSDWDLNDPLTYITIISDTSTEGGYTTNPNRAIEGNSNITSNIIINGFTIIGGEGLSSCAIYNDGASLSIENNIIFGGEGSYFSYGIINKNQSTTNIQMNTINGGNGNLSSYGIYTDNQSTTNIQMNRIHGGNPDDPNSSSFGITINNQSSSNIYNNIIYGGEGKNSSVGIKAITSSDLLRNNTINGGRGQTYSIGIWISSASPFIENNIIFTSVLNEGYGIYEDESDADPSSICNNDIFSCNKKYFDADGNGELTIDQINNYNNTTQDTSSPSNGNISVQPIFADIDGADNDISTLEDNDWRITPASPTIITQGGLNGVTEGWGFDIDMNSNNRTAYWSIGAYEFDTD